MAIGYWLFNNSTPESVNPTAEIEPDIAVLPFTNLSGNQENEYFSQGIAEELLTRLSRLNGLRVISRTSSFQFRDRQMDVREIGEILSVSHVLEGSVQRSNERVRINIRLIETASGTEVSALQYDRDLADIFELQTEIARSVSNNIQPTLLTINADVLSGYGTSDVKAYEAYLKGRFLLTKRLRGDMEQAASAFQEAIAHDPDYLLAHSGLIDTYALLVLYGYVPIPEMLEETKGSYKQLESSGAEFSEVLTSLGITNRLQGKKQRTIDYYERAIAANAQYAQSYLWLADLYLTGEPRNPETALSLVESALRIDPLSTVALMVLSRAQIETGAFKAVRKTTERLLELELYIQQVTKYLENKKVLGQGHIGAKMGRVYILTDQHEKAITFMRSAFEAGQRNGLYSRTLPVFAPLRKYSEYQLLQKDIELFFAQQREWLKEYPPMLP